MLGWSVGLQARGEQEKSSFVVCALNNAFKSVYAHTHTNTHTLTHTSITHLASPMSIPAMMELVSTCLSPLGWQIPFHSSPLSVREIDRSCHTVYMMCMNHSLLRPLYTYRIIHHPYFHSKVPGTVDRMGLHRDWMGPC